MWIAMVVILTQNVIAISVDCYGYHASVDVVQRASDIGGYNPIPRGDGYFSFNIETRFHTLVAHLTFVRYHVFIVVVCLLLWLLSSNMFTIVFFLN